MKRILFIIFLVILIGVGIWYYRNFHRTSQEGVIILYGNIDVRQVDLGFRVNGRVISMPYQEGDLVLPGDLMAELDIQPYLDQVKQAQANHDSVQVNVANAKRNFIRRQQLINTGSVSQEDLDTTQASFESLTASLAQAEAAIGVALTNLRETKVYAPTEGTILTRIREPGAVVRESDPVYTLSILSPVWVRAFVPEPLLGRIYPGMAAEVFTDSHNGRVYKGHIGFISPVAEFTPKTVETTELRTDLVYRLRIIADNPDRYLLQGMPVTVRLFTHE